MLVNVMHALANIIQPETYLEIGVREGASLISAIVKEKDIVCFTKLCLTDGETKLTHDIAERVTDAFTLRKTLKRIIVFDKWVQGRVDGRHIMDLIDGFKSGVNLEIYSGDSRITLPKFFNDEPNLTVDLALIDGGHADEIVSADLENMTSHFKILAVHDTYNKEYPNLKHIVKQYAKKHDYPVYFLGEMFVGTGVLLNLGV